MPIRTTLAGSPGGPDADPIVSWPAVGALIGGAALAVVELRDPGYSVAGVAALAAFTCFVALVLSRWWRWFLHSCRG